MMLEHVLIEKVFQLFRNMLWPRRPGGLTRPDEIAPEKRARRQSGEAETYSSLFTFAKAQSSQCVSAATSEASTVAPHQMRRPGGASR